MKRALFAFIAFIFLASFAPKEKLTWMAIGDSITYLDNRPEQTANRITRGYMSRVAEKLPYIQFENHGHSGWTASRMAGQIEKEDLKKADVYSIYYGTNDWNAGFPIGNLNDYQNSTGNTTLYGSYRTIIDKIRSLNPKAKVILITPMQRGDFVYLKDPKNNAKGSYADRKGLYLSQYADAIKSIAKAEKFVVVDLYYKSGMKVKEMVKFKRLKDPETGQYRDYKYPNYIDIPFNPVTDEYPYPVEAIDLTYDGLHPSDKGMEIIAKMLVKVMKKY
ncbi:SGNH/GDSL hydrolase family protein [Desertivirga brevis]|uniref:SGNH/GDSL hydrolase family protein n=1 Tax=Desertivirga brevis TaxID=2810310 RepID=UPI001A95B323|nr:SGNH/GDSL hydrolase family protein [Pedobacter sp. SYSU D00873]